MKIDWIGSPNFDTNRTKIDTIFIHWMAGTLQGTDAQFQKPQGTSAHYGIEDLTIHQYVKEEHVAYHAGVYSQNQRSIGIEHSAAPDRPASNATYETSGKLIAEICQRYSIPLDREHIRGHKEVRNTQCPGTIDIDRLISIAKSQSVPMVTLPQSEVDKMREDRDTNWNLYTASQKELESVKKTNAELNTDYEGVKQELSSYKGIIQTYATLLGVKPSETEKIAGEIKRLIDKEDLYNSLSKMVDNLTSEVAILQNEKTDLVQELKTTRQERDDSRTALEQCRKENKHKGLHEYSKLERFLSLFT